MSQFSTPDSQSTLPSPLSWLHSLWKFSRPHTIIGTTLSVVALYLIALATTDSSPTMNNLGALLAALIACWCGNIYIVGLNQLEDVAIDKVNKPHLPLAAEEFSLRQGKWIVGITVFLALLIASFSGVWLLATVGLSVIIGTAYSLPPIRLKRFPFWAAICIFTVRGAVVNLGLFSHFNQKLNNHFFLPPAVWMLTLFIILFTVAIAIFKDVPDLEGDKQYQITTFTILLGKQAVFSLARGVITISYLALIMAGFLLPNSVNLPCLLVTHLLLLGLLWWRSLQVDLGTKSEIASFYQFIWKLFFGEYLLFPIACLLNSSLITNFLHR